MFKVQGIANICDNFKTTFLSHMDWGYTYTNDGIIKSQIKKTDAVCYIRPNHKQIN